MYPGTFQQYVVSPASYVTPIPDSVTDLAAAAPLMCGGVSVYTALKRAGVKQGDWVVVSGAGGGLGHLAVQYARVLGGRVLGVDAGAKEALVRELGAEAFFDFTASASDEALAERVLEVTGGGAQIVMMCVGSARAYASGMSWLGFRGKLCCLGLPNPESEPALAANVLRMVALELSILGGFYLTLMTLFFTAQLLCPLLPGTDLSFPLAQRISQETALMQSRPSTLLPGTASRQNIN